MSEDSSGRRGNGTRSRWRQRAGELILVTLFGLPFTIPLWQWAGVPCTHDGHLHYHRVAAMRHAWENGLFFSRWAPDLAFGYGYPFFLFREPLPLYLTHFLHLAGLPLPAAANLFYAFCIFASGWFAFLWVRDIFGVRAGLVSAVAYMAAPYLLVDAMIRGNQVESLALALLPMLLWAGRRFLLSGSAGWFLVATFGLAALSLTHNISLLIFVPFLAFYLLVLGRLHKLAWRPLLLRVALVFGLGLGMTAFYTGSALLEMNQVTLGLSTTTRNNDFHFNFATLAEIFAPVAPEDPTLLNPPLLFRLGWAPTGLAVLGMLTFFWNKQREQRAHILLMTLAAALYLFFALAGSLPLWEGLPLIEFVQFPWRFVGRAALPVALLAGALFTRPPLLAPRLDRLLITLALPLALVLLFLEGIPNLYPAICAEDPFPTIQTVHQYEHETRLVGVDPEGSYFPRTVQSRPVASALEEDYANGDTPQRFDSAALPEDVTLLAVEYAPNQARIELDAGSEFQARYLTFAFPGWQVRVDGRPVVITPSDPAGLITFTVPAGEHLVEVRWGSTPLRTLLLLISAIALLGTIVAAVLLWRRGRAQPAFARPPLAAEATLTVAEPGLGNRTLSLLAGLALLMLLAKIAWFDRHDSPLRRPAQPATAYAANVEAGLSGSELRLAGYNLSRDTTPAGETFDIDLAWQTLAPPNDVYQSNVWLVGTDGLVWSDKETFRPRVYEDTPATLFWAPGQWAWDSREIRVLPGAPPGVYDVVLTLFPLDTLQPLTLTDETGVVLGPQTRLGQVTVTRPETPPTFAPQQPLDAEVNGLLLLGYNKDRDEAAPGDPLLLTLFWEKPDAVAASDPLILSLQKLDGGIAHQWSIPPVRDDYPPQDWGEGERVRGQHLLRLPAGLNSGAYTLSLEGTPSGAPDGAMLGAIQIDAPERLFSLPSVDVSANTQFGDAVILAGYTVDCPNEAGDCRLQLVWQALEELPTSYHVFAHLLDADGRIVAQSDGQPAGWTRPTTGWAPGEVVLDEHVLLMPLPEDDAPSSLLLRVGMYDPDSGIRLLTEDGGEFLTIPILSQSLP